MSAQYSPAQPVIKKAEPALPSPVAPLSPNVTAPPPVPSPSSPQPYSLFDSPPCIEGQKVTDWTVTYHFPGSELDPNGTADPDGIFVSGLDLNVPGRIHDTAVFKAEMKKIVWVSAFLTQDEQARLYNALKEVKTLKHLFVRPAETSYGRVPYRFRNESITYSHTDDRAHWEYSLGGNAGPGSEAFPITDLSRGSQDAVRQLNGKIEHDIVTACNDGEYELNKQQ